MGGVHLIMCFSCKKRVSYTAYIRYTDAVTRKCKSDGNFFIVLLPITKNEAFAYNYICALNFLHFCDCNDMYTAFTIIPALVRKFVVCVRIVCGG